MDFSKRIPKLLVAPLCMINCAFIGAGLSKIYSIYNNVGKGWDQMGNVLGGLMFGALCGLVIAFILLIRLQPSRLKRFFNYSLVFFGLIIAFIAFRMVTMDQ